jgi:hypothetical protein
MAKHKMKYDDHLRKMIEDLQRQMAPFKDYEGLYTSAFEDIARLAAERENFLHSLVSDIDRRYLGLTELAQKEVERYKETAYSATHMMEIVGATSLVSDLLKEHESLTRMARDAIDPVNIGKQNWKCIRTFLENLRHIGLH